MWRKGLSFRNTVSEKIKENKIEGNSIRCNWNSLKEAVLESAKTDIGHNKGLTTKKPWVSEEMIGKWMKGESERIMQLRKVRKIINS